MTVKEIVAAVKAQRPEITSVFFVGCGASMAELYPGKYFLEARAKKLRASIYTANEFNYSTPSSVDASAIVVTCSLSGTDVYKRQVDLRLCGLHVCAQLSPGENHVQLDKHVPVSYTHLDVYKRQTLTTPCSIMCMMYTTTPWPTSASIR